MSECRSERSPLSTGARFGLLAARIVMAGLFLFSGAAKLGWLAPLGSIGFLQPIARASIDPARFAGAINGFQVLHADLVPFAAFAIPWTEVVCAFALLLGIGTRGAARLIIGLLVIFCLAMVSVLLRGIDVDCSCFGKTFGGIFGKILGGPVSWLSITRNVVLMAIMLPVAKWGAGMLAIEHAIMPQAGPADV